MSETKFTVKDDKKTLVVERTFKAPKDKVWEAWTTPELFKKWWGPRGWNTTVKEMNVTDGGTLHYGMKCEDPAQKEWYGQISWGKMTFSNVRPKDSFEYVDIFCDENGSETPGMPASKTVLELHEQNGSTQMVSTTVYDKAEELTQVLEMGMKEGLSQTWDRLEELLA